MVRPVELRPTRLTNTLQLDRVQGVHAVFGNVAEGGRVSARALKLRGLPF